jgi:hypothetical protein
MGASLIGPSQKKELIKLWIVPKETPLLQSFPLGSIYRLQE